MRLPHINPTVYETFTRSWSTTSSSSTTTTAVSNIITRAAVAASTTSTISPVHSQTSTSISILRSGNPHHQSQVTSAPIQFQSQVRNMASTQPLTASTMPTPSELKIESPISDIQTGPDVTMNDHQKLLVSSVLDLFAGYPSLRKLSLWEDNGTFQDPITVAEGRKQFAAQWYGLAAAFSEIKRLGCKVTSAGNPILMDLSTMYKVKGTGTEKTIDSVIEIHTDDKTGKIVKVLDKWDGELKSGGVKHAFRKLNAVSVPMAVHVPKSIEEEESGK